MNTFKCEHYGKTKPLEDRGYGNQCVQCQLDIYYTGRIQK